jgi:hypothetical protein
MKRKNIKNRIRLLYLVSFSTALAFHGAGEEESAGIRPLRLEPSSPESSANLNRFGLSFRMGFNVKTRFNDVGPVSKPAARTNLDGDKYNYDNGYVYPDLGTPNSGLTHYWGYDSSSQLPGNGTILMHRTALEQTSSGGRGQDALPGFELSYNRELGRNGHFRWGLEAALNYMNVSVSDNQPIASRTITDAYALTVPENQLPPAGYEGRKNTPGVVINASPQSSTLSSAASGFQQSKFNADIFGFRFGPYVEMPLGRGFSAALSGGLALAEINSDFSYTVTGSPSGSGSHSDLLAGVYAGGTVSYAMTQSTSLVGGIQYQDLGRYTHTINRKEAAMDLSNSFFVTLGLSYSF